MNPPAPDDDPNVLDYAARGAGREQTRRRLRSRGSLILNLLVGGIITCALYMLLLWLVFWFWMRG